MKRLGLYSFGKGSWNASRVAMRDHPKDEHQLLFTDTLYEDADAYRFGLQGACWLFGRDYSWVPSAEAFPNFMVEGDFEIEAYKGNPEWRYFLKCLREEATDKIPELVWIVEGRDIWEIFRDRKYLGNTQRDPCSDMLKRKPRAKWMKENCDKSDTVVYIGIGDDEQHRYEAWSDDKGRFTGFKPTMEADGWMVDAPLIGKIEGRINASLYVQNAGLTPSRTYASGEGHDNCSKTCCKKGEAAIRHLYQTDPVRARYEAMMERKIIEFLGKDVAMFGRQPKTKKGEKKGPKIPESREFLHAKFDKEAEVDTMDLFAQMSSGGNGCGCAL